MQRSNRENGVLRQLKTEETELQLRLTQVRKAISVLDNSQPESKPKPPRCRAYLLRDYLLDHPGGVRLKDVPAVLEAMGHVSFAAHATTNWLYQLKPEKAHFVITSGVVTLRPQLNGGIPSASAVCVPGDLDADKAGRAEQGNSIGLNPELIPLGSELTSQVVSS